MKINLTKSQVKCQTPKVDTQRVLQTEQEQTIHHRQARARAWTRGSNLGSSRHAASPQVKYFEQRGAQEHACALELARNSPLAPLAAAATSRADEQRVRSILDSIFGLCVVHAPGGGLIDSTGNRRPSAARLLLALALELLLSQLAAQGSLDFPDDGLVWQRLAVLVRLNDVGLHANPRRQVLLAHLLGRSRLHNLLRQGLVDRRVCVAERWKEPGSEEEKEEGGGVSSWLGRQRRVEPLGQKEVAAVLYLQHSRFPPSSAASSFAALMPVEVFTPPPPPPPPPLAA